MVQPASDLPRLERLHHWLTLESWAGTAGVAGFWLPMAWLSAVLGLAAVAFTPYLVHALWALGRWGWLAAFVVLVGGTATAASTLAGPYSVLAPALTLLVFYVYTWALKWATAGWICETTEAAAWRRTQAQWAAERAAEQAHLRGELDPPQVL